MWNRFLSQYLWVIINVPACLFFIYVIVFPEKWKTVLEPTGLIAFVLLVVVLSLNPICKLWPKVKIIKEINKHRRVIGVSVFVYAFVHVSSYYIKKESFKAMAPYLLHPVILPAAIAFVILLILTLTSNNYSIRKLGGKGWKRLHKWVYLGEILIFLHMVFQGKTVLLWAVLGFVPLFILQRKRVMMKYGKD